MSKKKLLEEQVVRRFMKLANIDSLSEGFIKENKKVIKENMGMEPPMAPEQMDEVDELVDDDAMDMGGESGGGNEELFKKVAQAIADAMGVDAAIEGSGSAGGEDMGDLEMSDSEHEEPDEDNMGGPSDEDEDNMGDEEGMEDEEESDEEESDEEELDEEANMEELDEESDKEEDEEEEEKEEMDEQIAEAVLRRVKARLLAEAKAAKEKGKKMEEVSKMKQKIAAKKAGKKMDEASKGGKGHSTGKASSVNWGVKGNKGVANVAKSKAKKGNLTPAKKSTKHTK